MLRSLHLIEVESIIAKKKKWVIVIDVERLKAVSAIVRESVTDK